MDPLASLNDIHLPTHVHSYPIAPGWWLLAVVILALIIYSAKKTRRYYVKRKAQKTALKKLATETDLGSIVTLLKWAALQYFPRERVAHLTGDAFKTFLMATLPLKHQQKFIELSGDNFTAVYQSDAQSQTSENFASAARLWLSFALPPQIELSAAVTLENIAHNNDSDRNTIEKNGVKS